MNGLASANTAELTVTREAAELEARVRYQLIGRVCDFRLLAQEGGLVLQGRARTYYAKQLAQHAVMQETERPILANEIEVSRAFRQKEEELVGAE